MIGGHRRARGLVTAVALFAGCKAQPPRYTDEIKAAITKVAGACNSEPLPNGTAGYDEIVTCHPAGDLEAAMVTAMIKDGRLFQLDLDVRAPDLERALAALDPLLAAAIPDNRDAIAAELRRATPMGPSGRLARVGSQALVGIEQDRPGAPVTAKILLDFRTE